MSTRATVVPVLTLTISLIAGCGDAAPTAVEAPLPGDVSFAQSPGELTAGQVPETGASTVEIPNSWICGIEVTTVVFDTDAEWPAPAGPPVREAGLNVLTWINEDNGQWISSRLAGQVTREIVEFFPDGSLKIHEVWTHGVQLFGPAGAPLALSAGRLVLEFIVTPLPGGGFELTNMETLFAGGPRDDGNMVESPEFCAIVEDALL